MSKTGHDEDKEGAGTEECVFDLLAIAYLAVNFFYAQSCQDVKECTRLFGKKWVVAFFQSYTFSCSAVLPAGLCSTTLPGSRRSSS